MNEENIKEITHQVHCMSYALLHYAFDDRYILSSLKKLNITVYNLKSNDEKIALLNTPIDDLELSPRPSNCLKTIGINKVSDFIGLKKDDLMKINNFGKVSLKELEILLWTFGVELND